MYGIKSYTDYSPFGSIMSGRVFNSGTGKFGFQNQLKDDEIKGVGNSINFTYRMHDPRLGRFLSIDPLIKKFPSNSPFAFSENRVINCIELEGLESVLAISFDGETNFRLDLIQKLTGKKITQSILKSGTIVHGFTQSFVNATNEDPENGIGFVAIFGHGTPEKWWGSYTGSFEKKDLSSFEKAVGNGEIKFSPNAVIYIGNCNSGTSENDNFTGSPFTDGTSMADGTPFAQKLADITDAAVIGARTKYYNPYNRFPFDNYWNGGVSPLTKTGAENAKNMTYKVGIKDEFLLFRKGQEPVSLGNVVSLKKWIDRGMILPMETFKLKKIEHIDYSKEKNIITR